MSKPSQFAEVALGGRVLRLSPLSDELAAAFCAAVIKLEVARHQPGDSWRRALQNVGNFVYLAAKQNDPDLELSDVVDGDRAEPLLAAMVALSEVIRDHERGRDSLNA